MIGKIMSTLRKYKHNRHLKAVETLIKKGNSHLLSAFKIVANKPDPGKVYVSIGDDTMLNCTITFESASGEVIIGDRSFIGESQIICKSKIEIQNNVFIAWGCYLYDHDSHSLDYRERQNDIQQQLADYRNRVNFIENKNWNVVNSKPIKICSNAWIGMHCIILKGVTIGEGAIVAAGSVVTKNVAPWTVVGGNPAKILKEIPDEYKRK